MRDDLCVSGVRAVWRALVQRLGRMLRSGVDAMGRTARGDSRLRLALVATVALATVALVATGVVVLTGRTRAGAAAAADPTGCAAMTQPVRYQLDAAGSTGLLTTTDEAAAAAGRAGYSTDQGVLFRAASRPGPGLVEVRQLRLGTRDQLWTTNPAEVREAVLSLGYVDQGAVAYVSAVPGPCTLEVQRFQAEGKHRYAATKRQRDALRASGWSPEGSFYAARPAAGPTPATSSPTPEAGPTPRTSPTPTGEPPTEPVTEVDATFDGVPVGPVTSDAFIATVGGSNRQADDYDSMTFVEQGDGSRSRFVRTHLSAGTILRRERRPGDGNVLVVPLQDQRQDKACVAYDVRFSRGFDVSAGGKLPGLLGVAPGFPPSTPTGGGSTRHGWSGRVMWLGAKSFRLVRDAGLSDLAVTYLYHPGQSGRFGDDISWGRGLVDGEWHQVRQCYTLNKVGRADGRLRAWVDGAAVLDRGGVVYRTDPKVHITHLDWSVFRGGDTDAWESERGGDVDLDNVRVTVG